MIFNMVCEELLPLFGISGKCTLFESTPDNPTNIIRTNESWGVKFEWTTIGPLNNLMAGTWTLECFLEKMGPAEAPALPSATTAFVSAPNAYTKTLTFAPVNEGVYKLVTVLKVKGPLNVPGPIACMAEGPMVQFYVSTFP